jgi:2-desacetyl-2-hydroxyethyl bacteriochlorophyllide A dehydrogenase
MKARALLMTGKHTVNLVAIDLPAPQDGEVLIETLYTCISPGTELRCLAGKQMGAQFPFIPGYALVGRVIGRGAGVALEEGALVMCSGTQKANYPLLWGGHVSHAVRGERSVYPVPEGVAPLAASTAKLAAIAYRGFRLGEARAGHTVAVVGLGVIGQFAARLHGLHGARVVALDVVDTRVEVARGVGVEAYNSELDGIFRAACPKGADVVVDATGAQAAMEFALATLKDKPWTHETGENPRYIIQGSYPGTVNIPYQDAFLKEVSFWLPRDVLPEDLRAVLDLMQGGRLNTDGIVSDVRDPQHALRAYDDLSDPQSGCITLAFGWSS